VILSTATVGPLRLNRLALTDGLKVEFDEEEESFLI
jgi:hypothetical protein